MNGGDTIDDTRLMTSTAAALECLWRQVHLDGDTSGLSVVARSVQKLQAVSVNASKKQEIKTLCVTPSTAREKTRFCTYGTVSANQINAVYVYVHSLGSHSASLVGCWSAQ